MPHFGFGELMLAIVVPTALAASWMDYRFHRVPNSLNAAIAATGLAAQSAFFGWSGLSAALLGMLVGFGMLVLLWAIKGMGAGDVKFMAAIGAWLGPVMAFYAVCVGALIGGALALALIAARRDWCQAYANLGVLMAKVSSTKTAFSEFGSAKSMTRPGVSVLPYAIPLSLGALIVLVSNYSGWWEVL
ncbi:MAG: A24 family peptidase [Planctomycetota bacterium]